MTSAPQITPRHAVLSRSSTDRMLTGVCGGLAAWLGWSSTVVRVLFTAATVLSAGFPGVLVYLVLWIAMPPDPVST